MSRHLSGSAAPPTIIDGLLAAKTGGFLAAFRG